MEKQENNKKVYNKAKIEKNHILLYKVVSFLSVAKDFANH